MNIKGNAKKWVRAFDPHFIYGFIKDEKDSLCQKGTSIIDALTVLENYGCKPFIWEPWLKCTDTNTFNKFTIAVASNYAIEKAYALEQDKLVENVKWALTEKMPVIIGVNLTESFVSGASLKEGVWSPNKGEAFIGGHAMCV
ncbi:MAG: hypothetical protein IPG89_15310 [Bacteroidetes bacterium]|nr:hypothetical protein [Bacteroidota bacterium]